MSAPILGVVVGSVLGLLDGLSAWFYPEARPMIMTIVIGSTIKGLLTGLAAGLVAKWRRSLALGVATGAVVGLILSVIAAQGQPDHFWPIVLPGMLVGVFTGIITQRSRPVGALLLCLVTATVLSAQTSSSPLSALDPLIGQWQGPQEGQPGKGTVDREYSRILRSRFVQLRNRSTYPVQQKNPKGEEHEDVGTFSYDSARKRILLHQFHVEGFVIQYVMEPQSKPDTLVFLSEAIANIPSGYRARETYTIIGPDEFEEVFEIAEPGKDFSLYSRARLKRVK
jgi:hypothetical protein